MNITLSTGLYYLSNLFYDDIVFFFKHTIVQLLLHDHV